MEIRDVARSCRAFTRESRHTWIGLKGRFGRIVGRIVKKAAFQRIVEISNFLIFLIKIIDLNTHFLKKLSFFENLGKLNNVNQKMYLRFESFDCLSKCLFKFFFNKLFNKSTTI